MRRLVVLLLAVLLAGCGAPGEDAPEPESSDRGAGKVDVAAAGPVTLTVWDQEVRGGQRRQIETLNRQFQEKYPNVTIKRVAKSFTDLNTTLKLAVSGDRAPDVVQANQGRQVMGQLVKGGLLRPLDEYAEAYGWADRYAPVLLDLNRFSSDAATFGEGELYGLSQVGEMVGLFYNRDMVAEPPATFEQLEQMLADAKGRGEVPISFGNLDGWPGIHEFQSVLNAYARGRGARLRLRARGRGVRHARERQAAAKLQRVGEGGLLHQELQRRRLRPGVAAVRRRRRPVPDRGHVAAARPRRRDGRQARLHARPPPGGRHAVQALGGEGLPFTITSKSENPDVAAAYIDFLTNADAARRAGARPATCRPCRPRPSRRAPPARTCSRRGARSPRPTGWCPTSTTRRRPSMTTSRPRSSS